MKAIVGLGNPGREYAGTRHNIGFDVLDEVARRWHVQLRPWKSVADVAVVGSRGVVLVEPQTYMNLSGDAVSRVAAFHKLDPTDVLVVVDEVQLPLGRLRVRRNGSAGGHNGLKSIIQHIGAEFPALAGRRRSWRPRLRISRITCSRSSGARNARRWRTWSAGPRMPSSCSRGEGLDGGDEPLQPAAWQTVASRRQTVKRK